METKAEKNKKKEERSGISVFPFFTAVLVLLLAVAGFFFRYKFFMRSKDMEDLLRLTESFLDGMADSANFTIPAVAGTTEAYASIFSVTGVNALLTEYAIIGMESISLILLSLMAALLLSPFYAILCSVALSILPFFGVEVNIYEELAIICLLLFEIMLTLTRKYEAELDPGIPVIRYLFIGITGGLAFFLLPGNLIMICLSLLLALYYLVGRRGVKLLIELLISLFSGGAVFFLLVTMRVMNTGLLTVSILKSYGAHLLDSWGTQYLFTAVLLLILFIIETIESLLKGGKTDRELSEIQAAAATADEDEEENKESAPEDTGEGLKKRPVSTGGLPSDFVLHRAEASEKLISSEKETQNGSGLIPGTVPEEKPRVRVNPFDTPEGPETPEEKEKRVNAYRKYAENIDPNELEFDFEIPEDDDFDVEVQF